jgi:hypothetical protein
MSPISVRHVLEVVGDFDEFGGASLGLVAWELAVDEERVLEAWERAQADGLIKPAGKDRSSLVADHFEPVVERILRNAQQPGPLRPRRTSPDLGPRRSLGPQSCRLWSIE